MPLSSLENIIKLYEIQSSPPFTTLPTECFLVLSDGLHEIVVVH